MKKDNFLTLRFLQKSYLIRQLLYFIRRSVLDFRSLCIYNFLIDSFGNTLLYHKQKGEKTGCR